MITKEQWRRQYLREVTNDNTPDWDYVQAILYQAKCISEFGHDPLYQFPSPLTNQSPKRKKNAHWIAKFDHITLSNKKARERLEMLKKLKITNKGEVQ